MDAKKPYGLAVKAVITDPQNKCLLIRRSAACRHFVGQWKWPAGKADPGEDFAHAVSHEAREDTGLEVEITGFAGATSFHLTEMHVVLLCPAARVVGGEMRLSEELDDFARVAAGGPGATPDLGADEACFEQPA